MSYKKDQFLEILKKSGYVPKKEYRMRYLQKNKKKEYTDEDIVDAYRFYEENYDFQNWMDYRSESGEMGGTTKRYSQSARMGSDRK